MRQKPLQVLWKNRCAVVTVVAEEEELAGDEAERVEAAAAGAAGERACAERSVDGRSRSW
jgi:hypothetical protein